MIDATLLFGSITKSRKHVTKIEEEETTRAPNTRGRSSGYHGEKKGGRTPQRASFSDAFSVPVGTSTPEAQYTVAGVPGDAARNGQRAARYHTAKRGVVPSSTTVIPIQSEKVSVRLKEYTRQWGYVQLGAGVTRVVRDDYQLEVLQ
jgi:hypothetical protein